MLPHLLRSKPLLHHLPEVLGHLACGFLALEVAGEKLNVPPLHSVVEHDIDDDRVIGILRQRSHDWNFLAQKSVRRPRERDAPDRGVGRGSSFVAALPMRLLIVAIASLLRWLLTPLGLDSTPFITYFPAVLLATLFGGVWGGIVATAASAGMAWLVFLPPLMGLQFNKPEALALALFVAINVLDISLVTMLIRAYDLLAEQGETFASCSSGRHS
jgi:K+-sensing histidine kinase KdpD